MRQGEYADDVADGHGVNDFATLQRVAIIIERHAPQSEEQAEKARNEMRAAQRGADLVGRDRRAAPIGAVDGAANQHRQQDRGRVEREQGRRGVDEGEGQGQHLDAQDRIDARRLCADHRKTRLVENLIEALGPRERLRPAKPQQGE